MSEAYKRFPRSSSFYCYENCEASFVLSQASGEDPPTPFSDRGTEVHGVLSGKIDKSAVDDAIIDLAADLAEQHWKARKLWSGQEPFSGERVLETRLWLRKGMTPVYSGQPDIFEREGTRVMLTDYKSGWHPLDHIVATNCQLRSYVPLIDEHYDNEIDEVTAHIHKPGKKSPPAVFGRREINDARAWAIEVARRVTAKGPKNPNRGPWCTYCSGKVLCPLWRDEVIGLAELSTEIASGVPDAMLRQIAPRLALAATVIEKLRERLYLRAKQRPDLFPDWRFEPGDLRRLIDDNEKAFDLLVTKHSGLSFTEFLESSRLSVGDIEGFVRKNKKMTVAQAQEWMAKILAGVMTKKPPLKDKMIYDPQPKELANA
jgi:hypothetical protein